MAYLLLVGAGLRTALRTDRTFEKLLAVGLTTIIGMQAFIIVGGVIKVVPLTGITLPFVSYGGSSLVANYILLALLIRLSDSSARRLGELPDEPTPSERWKAWRLGRAAARPNARAVRRVRSAVVTGSPRYVSGTAGAMNRQIRQLAVGLMVCYVVLFVALNYWQVGRKEELDAQFDNTRQVLREFNKPRGPIVTADGIVAAISYPTDRTGDDPYKYRREYPTGDLLSEVTGYFTFAFGSTQGRARSTATCSPARPPSSRCAASAICSRARSTTPAPSSWRCAPTPRRSPSSSSAGAPGSIVVIEPATGAVRVMYSNPSYDPNTFVNADFEVAQQVITDLQNADGQPLLSGAYQERFMPGSTFKVITTGIGLENGNADARVGVPERARVGAAPDQRPDPELQRQPCGGDLADVFARSCNIAFAKTAIAHGTGGVPRRHRGVGHRRGDPARHRRRRGELARQHRQPGATSSRCSASAASARARSQMVPLHMAMVAATVANGGQMMAPYVVEATYDRSGRLLEQRQPSVWKTPISPATAEILKQLMIGVAERGTASCCIALEGGIPVAAKTGTAQLGIASQPDLSHAWIVAFAPADAPQYAGRRDAHQRAVDRRRRRHRWTIRRSDRQGDARLPAHRRRIRRSSCRPAPLPSSTPRHRRTTDARTEVASDHDGGADRHSTGGRVTVDATDDVDNLARRRDHRFGRPRRDRT